MSTVTTPARALANAKDASGIIFLGHSPVSYLDGSEEAVLGLVRDATDITAASTEMLSLASNWAERHNTDPARANVLRALDIPRDARVLEIGAGCGPITRYLGETAGLVDALEPVLARARVARERTRDLPNVEVFTGELADIPDEAGYELVVVVGVLELIASGAKQERPYLEFLEAIKRRLTPGGTLVIAIENKLGVKYLVGSPEEHTGRVFDSIEDYPHGTHARTFGRKDLTSLLETAGFSSRLLGVFPDYKITRAVLDTERLESAAPKLLYQIPTFPSPSRGTGRLALANEERLWKEIVGEGMARDFPNAFLAIARLPESTAELWPATRAGGFFSNQRRREFQANTMVEADVTGIRFVRTFAEQPSPMISQEMSVDTLVDGEPFLDIFAQASTSGRAELLGAWRSLVEAHETDRGLALDAIPQNVLVTRKGELRLIDVEFRSPEYSINFVIERGLLWLGIQLAQKTSPAFLHEHESVRDLVTSVGVLAGRGKSGSWIRRAILREAAYQFHVTTVFSGSKGELLWKNELNRLLDQPIAAMPLGRRLNDHFNELTGEHTALAQRASSLESDVEGLHGKLANLRAVTERALGESQNAAAVASAQLDAVLRSRAFRTISFARRTVDRIAPWGTHRRGLYERSLSLASRVARRRRERRATRIAREGVTVTHVPRAARPLVSIVVPIYGKWDFTSRCLDSIVRSHDGQAIEVIVVDDASPDDSRERLARIRGVRVVALDDNVGFTRAANAGMAAAKGEYIVMLNNDAEVTPGWLSALLIAAADENVGLVGAKLVYPDGRLQEAGGIIFDDGSGWNYGKFQHPDEPQYNFRKDVDYCSGAAILITRQLFALTGGFDERYAPAYYEDTDLAFEARAHGLRAVYEPSSVVIHHEGISHGSDELVGTKRFQPINREKFREKWRDELTRQYPASPSAVNLASVRRGKKGTIVVVDHMVPQWRDDAGSLRMHRILVSLVRMGHEVVFVTENKQPYQPYTAELQAAGVLVWYGHSDLWSYLRDIESEVAMVMLSRASIASLFLRTYRDVLPDVPIVYDTVDLHFLREERRAALSGAGGKPKGALATRELELALVRSMDATIVVADYEKAILTALVPDARIFVLPTAHDSEDAGARVATSRTDISFVGSFQHDPNVDAVRWLVNDIFPRIKKRLPRARLTVVGRNPPPDLVRAAPPGVVFLGWVEDLEPVYARSIVSVAPLRYGAGVKGKVGEAWAHGIPVVMTSLAAEGMHVEPGVTALVADDPEGITDAIVRLHEDAELWKSLAQEGRAHVDRTFGRGRFRALLSEILEFAKTVKV